jgi:hypothetical protein
MISSTHKAARLILDSQKVNSHQGGDLSSNAASIGFFSDSEKNNTHRAHRFIRRIFCPV